MPTKAVNRAIRRKRMAGATALEEILSIAALLGCFAYPLSIGARAAGAHIAAQTEAAHQTLLTQK